MAHRNNSSADGSDIVYRVITRLVPGRKPTVDHLAFLVRSHAELEPFTVGDGDRARYLREFNDQLARVIACARREVSES